MFSDLSLWHVSDIVTCPSNWAKLDIALPPACMHPSSGPCQQANAGTSVGPRLEGSTPLLDGQS